MIKERVKKVGGFLVKCIPGALVLGSSVVAIAEPTLTVPDIDTATLYSCAGKAFAAVAIIVAILIGLRLFKGAAGR